MKKLIKSLIFFAFVIWVSYSLNFGIGYTLLFGLLTYSLYKIPFLLKRYFSKRHEEKAEERLFKKQLRWKVEEEEAIGKAKNKAKIELLTEQTNALIAQMKAGGQVHGQLLDNFKELTALGDSSYEYLKKEIESMPTMKNTNFNL